MHRPCTRLSALALLALTTLTLSACSEDAAPSEQPPATTPDPDQPRDTPTDTDPDVDALPDQPTTPQPDAADDMIDMIDMTVDAPSDMPDMMVEPDMPEPEFNPDPCAYPTLDPQCSMGPFGPGSFITQFIIPPNDQCCHDLNGDGDMDNVAGASILNLAQALGGIDINGNVATAINLGLMVYLFEFRGLQDLNYDPDVTLSVLTGVDADPTEFNDNLAGTGAFRVDAQGLDPGTGLPREAFQSARVDVGGKLHAEGGTLRVYFPGLIDDVELRLINVVLDAELRSDSTLTAGGRVRMGNGKLSGAVLRDPLFTSLNQVAAGCGCMTAALDDEPLFSRNSTSLRWECNLKGDACTSAFDPSDCRNVGESRICSALALVGGFVDLDTDGDGLKDAFSLGATFEAVGAELQP